MITQKAISVKINVATLEELDRECYHLGKKRNRLINDAVVYYMKHLDKVRVYENMKNMTPELRDEYYRELGKYILFGLTDEEEWKLRFTAHAIGEEREHVMLLLIRRGLEDFEKRPFSYL